MTDIVALRAGFEIFFLALIYFLEGAFPLFAGRTSRHRHAAVNLGFGLINAALVSLLLSSAMVAAVRWAEASGFGLLRRIELPAPLEWALALAAFDAWMYAWHRANHELPFLWRFHRVHHTDREMDCTTALRFHAGEIALSWLARLAVLPLLGMSLPQLAVYELLLQPVILFHHSNIALPEAWDRALRALIVTPNMHRVHHSQIKTETNSNYSSVLSVWDRLLKSLRLRADVLAIRYGIPEFPEPEWQRLPMMIKTPFARR